MLHVNMMAIVKKAGDGLTVSRDGYGRYYAEARSAASVPYGIRWSVREWNGRKEVHSVVLFRKHEEWKNFGEALQAGQKARRFVSVVRGRAFRTSCRTKSVVIGPREEDLRERVELWEGVDSEKTVRKVCETTDPRLLSEAAFVLSGDLPPDVLFDRTLDLVGI